MCPNKVSRRDWIIAVSLGMVNTANQTMSG